MLAVQMQAPSWDSGQLAAISSQSSANRTQVPRLLSLVLNTSSSVDVQVWENLEGPRIALHPSAQDKRQQREMRAGWGRKMRSVRQIRRRETGLTPFANNESTKKNLYL